MNKQKLYIVIVSVIGMLAAFMPWINVEAYRFSVQNVSGIQGDGKITLVLFAVACALCFIGNKQEKLSQQFTYGLWAVGVVNVIIFFVLIMNANSFSKSTFGLGSVNLAHGAYLTLLAAIGILVFSIEQLQMVAKVDNLLSRLTTKK